MENKKENRRIYLDYAASTPVDEQVLLAMEPYWSTDFGNPGSLHSEGVRAKRAIDKSRHFLATMLAAQNDEIIFTGSGTEANNIAIFGIVNNLLRVGVNLKEMHFVTSVVEHPSVLDVFKDLEKRGAHVTYVGVDIEGCVSPTDVSCALKEDTVLVSIMFANNEIGSINQIQMIGKTINEFKRKKQNKNNKLPHFHVDASQALLFSPLDVKKLGVDLLTIDAQKIYGPKGIGALYKKRDVEMEPVIIGGNQEFSLRPGTENVPLIVGFARACELVEKNRKTEITRLLKLRDHFLAKLEKFGSKIEINGGIKHRAPNNVNLSIRGIVGEYAVVLLDKKGIACGTRSACVRNGDKESYVVEALGKSKELVANSLRFTLGKHTSIEDIDYTISALKEIINDFDICK